MSLLLPTDQEESWLPVVRQKLQAIRFGSVQLVVHEDRVTLVESTEKIRIAPTSQVFHEPSLPQRRSIAAVLSAN